MPRIGKDLRPGAKARPEPKEITETMLTRLWVNAMVEVLEGTKTVAADILDVAPSCVSHSVASYDRRYARILELANSVRRKLLGPYLPVDLQRRTPAGNRFTRKQGREIMLKVAAVIFDKMVLDKAAAEAVGITLNTLRSLRRKDAKGWEEALKQYGIESDPEGWGDFQRANGVKPACPFRWPYTRAILVKAAREVAQGYDVCLTARKIGVSQDVLFQAIDRHPVYFAFVTQRERERLGLKENERFVLQIADVDTGKITRRAAIGMGTHARRALRKKTGNIKGPLPRWDREKGLLLLPPRVVVRRDVKRAKNQTKILDAFEAHRWEKKRVPDPLVTKSGYRNQNRLRQAVKELNLCCKGVVFGTDDGKFVTWRLG